MLNSTLTLLKKIVELVENPNTELFLTRLALLILLVIGLAKLVMAELR